MRSTKARSVLSIVVYSLLISSVFIIAGCDIKEMLSRALDVKSLEPKVSVTYDLNGATAGDPPTDTNTYAVNSQVRVAGLPADVVGPSGRRTFVGWSTQSNGGGTNVTPGSILNLTSQLFAQAVQNNNSLTLYAIWS